MKAEPKSPERDVSTTAVATPETTRGGETEVGGSRRRLRLRLRRKGSVQWKGVRLPKRLAPRVKTRPTTGRVRGAAAGGGTLVDLEDELTSEEETVQTPRVAPLSRVAEELQETITARRSAAASSSSSVGRTMEAETLRARTAWARAASIAARSARKCEGEAEKSKDAGVRKRKGEKQEDPNVDDATPRQKRYACRLKKSEVARLSSTTVISPDRAEVLALQLDCACPPGGGSEVAIHDFLVGQLLPCQAVRAAAVRWGAVVSCEKRSDVPEALATIIRRVSKA